MPSLLFLTNSTVNTDIKVVETAGFTLVRTLTDNLDSVLGAAYDAVHNRLYGFSGGGAFNPEHIAVWNDVGGAYTPSFTSHSGIDLEFGGFCSWTARHLYAASPSSGLGLKALNTDTNTAITTTTLVDMNGSNDSVAVFLKIDQVHSQIWVNGNNFYGTTPTRHSTLYCIDALTGTILFKCWVYEDPANTNTFYFDVATDPVGGKAYILRINVSGQSVVETFSASSFTVTNTLVLPGLIADHWPLSVDPVNNHLLTGPLILNMAGTVLADLSTPLNFSVDGVGRILWDGDNNRIIYITFGTLPFFTVNPSTFISTNYPLSFSDQYKFADFADLALVTTVVGGAAAALAGGLVGHGSLAGDLTAPGALGAAPPISIPSAVGEVPLILHPQKPVYLRPKSTTASIDPTTFHFEAGFSNVIHKNLLPEADVTLSGYGATVILDTIEHRAPVTGQIPITLSSGSLVFTKGTNNTADIGIYEIKIPATNKAACLGYFKFRTKTAWTRFSPDWINTSNMIGMVFGLEHGSFNTAAYMFLRDDGANGSLVVGGPMQTLGAGRPGQAEISGFDWLSFPDNSVVEFYVFFNPKGHSPSYAPVVEFWTKGPLDTAPVKEAFVPISDLGTYPSLSSNASNSRLGPSDYLTLYFGNTGRTGDVLQLDDWQLYQDFQVAADLGAPSANNIFDHLPDAPVMYRAADGLLPEELVPGRWYVPDPGLVPTSSFHYQPSIRSRPDLLQVNKQVDDISNRMIYQKKEPRLSHSGDGFMVEGYISVNKTSQITLGGTGSTFEGTGMGFGVCDGVTRFEIMGIDTGTVRTLGLVKNQGHLDQSSLGFYTPTVPVDLTNPVLCRLCTDYNRGKIEVFAGDMTTPIISRFSLDTFPSDSGPSMVFFGHIEGTPTKGTLGVKSLTYLPRYRVYEGVDGSTPNFPWVSHISGAGTGSVVSQRLVVNKSDVNVANSKVYYSYASSFSEQGGCLVDFNTQVIDYKSITGQLWPKLAQLGAGIKLNLGNKVLSLDFFDCGAGGRRIGIIPGSGSASDIINQTILGLSFSAPVDWTQIQSYRIVLRANDSIRVYVGSPTSDPLITIPWTSSGFDLPLDATAASLNIGHFDQNTSSSITWGYVRWGVSNGYEMAVTRVYPDGVRPSYFGGKYLLTSTFSETP